MKVAPGRFASGRSMTARGVYVTREERSSRQGSRTMIYRSPRAARAVRYVTYSQIAFFGMVAICIVLIPRPATGNLGLSFYGTRHATVVLYTAGLLLSGYFLIKAAHALPQDTRTLRLVTEALLALGILVVGVCLTPYSLDMLFDRAHIATSTVLFLVELWLAIWLVYRPCRNTLNAGLLLVQIAGALISMFSVMNEVDLMLPGELVTQLAFGILMIRCLHQLTRVTPRAARRELQGST